MIARIRETHSAIGGQFGRLLRPFSWRLGVVVGLLSLLAMANMALPLAIKILIDDVFPSVSGGGAWGLLWFMLPALAVIYVCRNLLFYSGRMMSVRIAEDMCFRLRGSLFEHLQQLSLNFYRNNQAGKLGARVMDDTFKLQTFIQEKLPTLLLNVLMLHILVIILYSVNWRLALVSTIVLPLHLATYRFFKGSIKQSHSQAQDSYATAYGSLIERILGMEVVKGFAAERRESAEFDKAISDSRRSQIRTQRFQFGQKVTADLLIGAGTVLLLGVGAWQVKQGAMTAGSFFMFFGYVMMLYPTVLEVLSGASHLARATGSVERIFEVFDLRPTDVGVHDELEPDDGDPIRGSVVFEDVGFSYDGRLPALKGVSLRIEPGEHVAVVGPSGSGKSTLASLLPRFNVATEGRVLIDGEDVRTLPLRRLRTAIGIVFQRVFLFNASIYENLLYARPDASFDEIVEVCRVTGAHEFIERLPNGYHTSPDQLGGELSRGEQQRITLARALLKRPRLLILDEATASLDGPSSRRIVRAILKMMKGRTVIMITHDSDLASLADRVVELEHGRVRRDVGVVSGVSGGRREEPKTILMTPDPEKPIGGAGGRIIDASTRSARLIGPLLVAAVLLGACVSETTQRRSFEVESPRATHGWVDSASDAAQFDEVVAALEARREAEASMSMRTEAPVRELDQIALDVRAEIEARRRDRESGGDGASKSQGRGGADPGRFPPEAGRLIELPRLSRTELDELIDTLLLRFQTELGYAPAGEVIADMLPALPERVSGGKILARSTDEGLRLVRMGYRRSLSQPALLWIYGVVIKPDTVVLNEDLDRVGPAVEAVMAGLLELRGEVFVSELEAHVVQLSYVDAQSALSALKGLGVKVVNESNAMPPSVTFDDLPIVTAMPGPASAATALVGGGEVARDPRGQTLIPSVASRMDAETVSGRTSQLLVLHHPAHPEQPSRLIHLLNSLIDVPARQVFIEGMVLEISEEGLRELGVEWEFQDGSARAMLGALTPGIPGAETLDFLFRDSLRLPEDWAARIRALVRTGKAEILSRPGVLTLDNRQATIRVGEDIPIATSQEGVTGGSSKIAFDFRYIPTGILLNVRPRIDAENEQISMQIDTTVSAVVPGADLELRDPDGRLLASAPTVSSRRVQTYARIANNTPFIIGGLVSRDNTVTMDKVPLLGDLPLIGGLFRAERRTSLKREVIIVLTPYVLPERSRISRAQPRTDDRFDSFGNVLFRDSYRMREEEVFDLRFLTQNRRLRAARDLVEAAVRRDFRLAERRPFRLFIGERVPSEPILASRMIYEVVKRLQLDDKISDERLIFFEPDPSPAPAEGYRVRFLEDLMSRLGDDVAMDSFFTENPDRALAISFSLDRDRSDAGALGSEPVPEITLVPCADRDRWMRMLWELNQPLEDGRRRFTILIHNQEDLQRLRRSIALKRIVELNGGREALSLGNVSVGKLLMMPDLEGDKIHVIDVDVARFFFYTEHYYPATTTAIEAAIRDLEEAMQTPELRDLLEASELEASD
ncbi:MAG: ATP-binding cassette domain-containing protein [Phycisphaeraceae bacterium]|nr:MAG: ATP-binding cassette domain-containing protein [Phycisphaeraceae bacterium]